MMSTDQDFPSKHPISVRDRVSRVLSEAPFRNSDNWGGVGDVELTVTGTDGYRVKIDVHRKVLVDRSRFFKDKIRGKGNHVVEICDIQDVELYVEVVVLMYFDLEGLKNRLFRHAFSKVLGLLKVSAALMFDDGVMSCLEYLEAVPWSDEEEEKMISLLNELKLHNPAKDVLKRVSVEPSTCPKADDIFLKLSSGILQAKDEKARREMKTLMSRLLREDSSNHNNKLVICKDTIYNLCHRCLTSLILSLSEATCADESSQDRGVLLGEIAREVDNMQWIVDILINRKIADDFVRLWADQKELAILHSKIPTMYRHEISRITSLLCISIGRGYILVAKETRYALLCTWLEALYDDFGWMKRACRFFDKNLVEDGLSQTILTLPLPQQQTILLDWFDRYLNKGDDCPNIRRAFEVWWRRTFVRQYGGDSHLDIAICHSRN